MLKLTPNKQVFPAAAVVLMLILAAVACAIPVEGIAPTATITVTITNTVTNTATFTATLLSTAAMPSIPTVAVTPALATPVSPTSAPPATVVPPATSAPPPGSTVSEVLIYMVAMEDNGASGPVIGCGDSIIPVRREVAATTQPLRAALDLLLAQNDQYYGQSGLYNALYQSDLVVESAVVNASGAASVALVGPVRLGGTCDVPRFKAQIEQTILSISGVQSASILLNGVPIDAALSQQ